MSIISENDDFIFGMIALIGGVILAITGALIASAASHVMDEYETTGGQLVRVLDEESQEEYDQARENYETGIAMILIGTGGVVVGLFLLCVFYFNKTKQVKTPSPSPYRQRHQPSYSPPPHHPPHPRPFNYPPPPKKSPELPHPVPPKTPDKFPAEQSSPTTHEQRSASQKATKGSKSEESPRKPCPYCNKQVNPQWNYCPYCKREFTTQEAHNE